MGKPIQKNKSYFRKLYVKNTYNQYYSFNKCLGIDVDHDNVNKSMYFVNLKDVHINANKIICFYSKI